MKRCFVLMLVVVVSSVLPVGAVTLTVSKGSGGHYTSVQAAVDAAGPGDEVIIIDTSVYNEQVTIDGTKRDLVLRSEDVQGAVKPVLMFTDTLNVGPRNFNESLDPRTITYYRNGALRLINARGVIVEGIAVDGGGVTPFGHDQVWEGRYAMQHGNAAVCMVTSGEVIIRHCDIRNAYFGFYITDMNTSGIFAIPNVADGQTDTTLKNDGPLSSGNHLLEHNRIHDNSYGLFFENAFDMGSTVRYNLIYENHHPDSAVATRVKTLTSEGGNQSGGAFCFKNHLLSPLAIYNNTLWHNSTPFLGNWKSGGQHLIFNNIIAEPNEYWETSTTTFSTSFEMSKTFVNRMHATVYAAQLQKPAEGTVLITTDLKPVTSGGTLVQGALISPFSAAGEVRWVETKFLSVDPSSADFLVPDWSDPAVAEFIVDKGWEPSGVKDPDASRADLGALPKGSGRFGGIVTIRPVAPVMVDGSNAVIKMHIAARRGSMSSAKATLFGLVRNLDTSDVFGAGYNPISADDVIAVPLQSFDVVVGSTNTINVPFTLFKGNYSFFEVVVEGNALTGATFTSAVGFIPYRSNKWNIQTSIELLDSRKTGAITTIRHGEPFVVRVRLSDGTDEKLTDKVIDRVSIRTVSGRELATPSGDALTILPGGIGGGSAEFEAVYVGDGEDVEDNIIIYSQVHDDYYPVFYGCSDNLLVRPAGSAVMPQVMGRSPLTGTAVAELIDLSGRVVYRTVGTPAAIKNIRSSLRRTVTKGVYILRVTDRAGGAPLLHEKFITGR